MAGPADRAERPERRVALLRGINLGGARKLSMAGLREVAEGLGWTEVATHLQSGNLLFRADGGDSALARQLSTAVREAFGIEVDVVVRTGEQLRGLVAGHPFAGGDPARVVVVCCDQPVGELAARRLAALAGPDERFEVAGADVFADFPAGQAGSRLAAGLVAALRPATGTARNLRTMTRLVELLSGE